MNIKVAAFTVSEKSINTCTDTCKSGTRIAHVYRDTFREPRSRMIHLYLYSKVEISKDFQSMAIDYNSLSGLLGLNKKKSAL